MKYNIVKQDQVILQAKKFIIPIKDLKIADYKTFYKQACHKTPFNFDKSYGIYHINGVVCNFYVGMEYDSMTNGYEEICLKAGTYYEFELDLMKNSSEYNIYSACYDLLQSNNEVFDMSYSFELMQMTAAQTSDSFLFKFYILKG